MRLNPFAHALALLVFLLGLLPTGQALAADCKGLSQTQCQAKDSCTWVSAYTTKKGIQVSAYCRAKPAKGRKKAQTGTSQTARSKTKSAETRSAESKTAKKKAEKTATSGKKAEKSKKEKASKKRKKSKKDESAKKKKGD